MNEAATAPARSAPPLVLPPDPRQDERAAAPEPRLMVESLRAVWLARRMITRISLAGVLLAAVIAFSLPKRYQAVAQLMPPDSQAASGATMLAALTAKTGTGAAGFASDLLGLKTTGALFVGILRSRTVADRLVARFAQNKVHGAGLVSDAREVLGTNTTVSEDRKSGIITIVVTDRSPQRAAALAGAYVEELNRLVAELSTSAAHRERVFLEERLKAVKRDLDTAATQFGEFASKNTAIDIKEQGRAMVEAAASLQGQLIAAQAELQMLRQIYADRNVRVRAAEARIGELRRQLEKMGGDERPTAAADDPPGENSGLPYPTIRRLPLLGVTYSDYYRRTKIQEAVYETLTQSYELAKVQEAKETPSVKLLDSPVVPDHKSFPPRLLILFLGGAIALTLGVLWALANARWERTAPDSPGKALALEVYTSMREQMPWVARNGSSGHPLWSRLLTWRRPAKRDAEKP